MQILYPSDPLDTSQVDDTFKDEFLAAKAAGHDCLLFEFDALRFGEFRPKPKINSGSKILYRGWMLNLAGYASLIQLIEERGGIPIVQSQAYARCHHLLGWYTDCHELTAKTRFCQTREALVECINSLGWDYYFIKDYVKSNTAGIGSVAQNAEQAVEIVDMIEMYRGEIEGGIAVRRFEEYTPETEKRYFVVNGQPFSPDGQYPKMLDTIISKIQAPFYSADLIKLKFGGLRLVELGDGQVSSPKNWEIPNFMNVLNALANH